MLPTSPLKTEIGDFSLSSMSPCATGMALESGDRFLVVVVVLLPVALFPVRLFPVFLFPVSPFS